MMMFGTQNILDFFTLSTLEIILGIDNIIFIAIIAKTLPKSQRTKARAIGIVLAFVLRVLLLFSASWVIGLTEPIFSIHNFDLSGRNILLIIGGFFLIFKSLFEIKELFIHSASPKNNSIRVPKNFTKIICQIVFVDLILSFDSVITAVGMSNNMYIIIASIIIAMFVMFISYTPIATFIDRHPSVKVIALCFIALIGIMLLANGLNIEFPKAYIYITTLFSIIVETLNIKLKSLSNAKRD
jgi:predicted tellurium resistance membrane protein TerC